MQAFDAFDIHMSLKIHMLHAHYDFYEQQLSTETDEVGERFHQTIKVFEERFSGKRFQSTDERAKEADEKSHKLVRIHEHEFW